MVKRINLMAASLVVAMLTCATAFAQDTIQERSKTKITFFERKTTDTIAAEADSVPQLTTMQIGARQAAITLLNYDKPYSRKGLIEELEYEGYIYGDAATAVDGLNVNWGNQAKDMAKNYLRLDAFSKTGLVQQLEEEGFSHEDAVYGVKNSGANWMAQAKRMASDFSKTYANDRDDLIHQLEEKGFTHEQAVYGANQNGFRDENSIINKIKSKFSRNKDDD